MAIDFTSFNAALNKVIRPAIEAQMYARAPMWQLIGGWSAEKPVATRANTLVDRFENNKMYVPLRLSYHSGYAAVGVSEKYNYGQPKIDETYSTIKTLVTSFTIPKQILNTKDAGSIVKPLKFYSDGASRDLAMNCNRQVYYDGTAVVATTNAIGSSTTTLDLAPSLNGDIDYARYLPEGTLIKIGSNSPVLVTAQTGDNQVTIASAQSWTAGQNVVLMTGDSNAMTEMDGFKSMIAGSGSYQNYNTTSSYAWKSPVSTNTETIGTSTIQSKIHSQFFKASKVGNVSWIIMNSTAFQTYGNSLASQVRFQAKEVLSGGWKGLDYMQGNASVLLDFDCPDDSILGLTVEDIVFGEYQKFEFEKGTDGVLLKIANKLDYEVTGSWMGNIGTVARAAHFAMRGKTFTPAAA